MILCCRDESTIKCTKVNVKPYDPCLSTPCQNSGECMASDDGTFICICNAATTGTFCETSKFNCINWVSTTLRMHISILPFQLSKLDMNVPWSILYRTDAGIFYLSKNMSTVTKNRTL